MSSKDKKPPIPPYDGPDIHGGEKTFIKLRLPIRMHEALKERVQRLERRGDKTDLSKEIRLAAAFLLEHPEFFEEGGLERVKDDSARKEIAQMKKDFAEIVERMGTVEATNLLQKQMAELQLEMGKSRREREEAREERAAIFKLLEEIRSDRAK